MRWTDVSLLDGWFPTSLACLALATLGVACTRPQRRWWVHRVLPISAVSLLGVIVLNWLVDIQARFGDAIPVKFLIWVSIPLVATGVAAFGWRGDPWWRRVVSVAAVPLTLLYAANLINQFYAYEPTLGAPFGSALEHQVDANQLGLHEVGPAGTSAGAMPIDLSASFPSPATTSVAAEVKPATTTLLPTVPAATVPAPQAGHGTISKIDIPGTVSGFHARQALVWVPPAFFATPRRHLPVVVMLSGVPGQPDNMIRAANANQAADAYAATNGGVAPILIFPDENGSLTGDSECVDGPRGNSETYLTQDVPNFVTQAFSTLAGPAHWGIAGYSEGGTCALDLALGHPDVYGSFVDIAGDAFPNLGLGLGAKAKAVAGLYGGDAALFDAHDALLLVHKPAAKSVAGWFEAGTKEHRDRTVAATLDAALRAVGLQSHLMQAPGGHDFKMATRAVADSFAWLARRVGS